LIIVNAHPVVDLPLQDTKHQGIPSLRIPAARDTQLR
jgi:hypothetical protein